MISLHSLFYYITHKKVFYVNIKQISYFMKSSYIWLYGITTPFTNRTIRFS